MLGLSYEVYLLAEPAVGRVWRGVAAASHAHSYFTLLTERARQALVPRGYLFLVVGVMSLLI